MKKSEFGTYIKVIRESCGLTQEKFAERLGFHSSQSVANIESGRTLLPKDLFLKFVETFRLDPEDFINAVAAVKRREISEQVYGKMKSDLIYKEKSKKS